VADALSRREEEVVPGISDGGPIIDLSSKEFNTEQYLELRKRIHDNQSKLPDLRVVDNFVYKKTEPAKGDLLQEEESWKLWVPINLVDRVLVRAHRCCTHRNEQNDCETQASSILARNGNADPQHRFTLFHLQVNKEPKQSS